MKNKLKNYSSNVLSFRRFNGFTRTKAREWRQQTLKCYLCIIADYYIKQSLNCFPQQNNNCDMFQNISYNHSSDGNLFISRRIRDGFYMNSPATPLARKPLPSTLNSHHVQHMSVMELHLHFLLLRPTSSAFEDSKMNYFTKAYLK